MSPALLVLLGRNLRGRLVRRLRLLKKPRYLVTLLAGVGYFALIFGPRLVGFGGPHHPAPPPHLPTGALVSTLGALALAAATTLILIFASGRPALRLTAAEVHLLFPAPLRRREIVTYALLKEQPGILLGTFFLLFAHGGRSPGERVVFGLGAWGILTLINLHLRVVSFEKARLRELQTAAAARRRAAAIAVFALYWLALALALESPVRTLLDGFTGGDPGTSFARAASLLGAAPLRTLLAPFAWTVAPLTAAELDRRLLGAAFLGALLVAHYLWVVASDTRFEEATLERARRLQARGSRRDRRGHLGERGRLRRPFALPPTGRPEAAIYWKNLMLLTRRPLSALLRTGALFIVVLLAAAPYLSRLSTAGPVLWGLGFILVGATPFFAPLWLRNDLRADLLHVATLRTWPVPAPRLVLAEVLAPATFAGGLMLAGCGLMAAGAVALRAGGADLTLSGSPSGAGALAAALAAIFVLNLPLTVLALAVHNLAALLWPGWVPLGLQRGRGTAAFGQNLLLALGQLLALLFGLAPGAALAAVAAVAQLALGLPFRSWELPLLALLVGSVLAGEAWLVIRAAGARWRALDPAGELLADGGAT